METIEYSPRKNQLVSSRSTEKIPGSYSGIIKTINIDTLKKIPVNFNQNLCFSCLRVKAIIQRGIRRKIHKLGYCKKVVIVGPVQTKFPWQGNENIMSKINSTKISKRNFFFILT